MINVICPSCSFNNKLVFDKKLMGKKIMFSCKNPSCKKRITHTFPNALESLNKDYETILTDYKQATALHAYLKWADPQTNEVIIFQINSGVNIIGRQSSTNEPDIAIPASDKSMSRMHCVIIKSKEGVGYKYLLKEYSNKNPLKLNTKELPSGTEVYLELGDMLSLGSTTITFDLL